MSTFQIAALALTALFALASAVAAMRRRVQRGVGLAWTLVWIAAGAAIYRPEITVVAARAVGIDRGADLVFYCAILAMIAGFFAVYLRLRRIERGLTVVVRRLALLEAEGGGGEEAGERAGRGRPLPPSVG